MGDQEKFSGTLPKEGENSEEQQQENSSALQHISLELSNQTTINNNSDCDYCPTNIKEYNITRTLGTGGFARVYLAQHDEKYYAMKILKKSEMVRLKQVGHIISEKKILESITMPFVVRLYQSFQDKKNLFMVMEYILGGELFSYLRAAGRFTNPMAKFYAAEIVLALEHLHSFNIVYRDLKPENLLLDKNGHIKLIDFGFAKVVERSDRTWTTCGTPEYIAPEIIQMKGHGKPVDWWALGILIFEMLAGYPPFSDENSLILYEKILCEGFVFPEHIRNDARDIIRQLLTKEQSFRLGNLKNGAQDIKNHPWFKGVDWNARLQCRVTPPIIPNFAHPGDTGNFDIYPEERPLLENSTTIEDPYRFLFSGF